MPANEVIDDGEFWRIKIKDTDKIFAKKVSTEKNHHVKVDVAVDLKMVNGAKNVDVSVANVYYPKYKYSKEDIEAKMDDVIKKANDPSCPLCARFKAALSVDERRTILDELMLPSPDLFSPRTLSEPALDAVGNLINDTLKSFELFIPGAVPKVNKNSTDRVSDKTSEQ
jgi:hypothetical protein